MKRHLIHAFLTLASILLGWVIWRFLGSETLLVYTVFAWPFLVLAYDKFDRPSRQAHTVQTVPDRESRIGKA